MYKRCNVEIVDICEQIANLTLFQIDRARIMELKDLRAKIETVKYELVFGEKLSAPMPPPLIHTHTHVHTRVVSKIETIIGAFAYRSDRIIKIVEKYDLIVKYVTVIYEGFKDSMDNVRQDTRAPRDRLCFDV